MIDTHTHSTYSADGFENTEDIILKGISLGLSYIAITDHLDRDYLYGKDLKKVKQLDIEGVYKNLYELKNKYKNLIKVGIGVEIGYSKDSQQECKKIVNNYQYDYIINSVHTVNGKDAYFKSYFDGKDKILSYGEYLDCVLSSVDAIYSYHAIAHIGYLSRYAPYENKFFSYEEFSEKLDNILNRIIHREKILEVNTNSYGSNSFTLPNEKIIKRYFELGGRLVSFASDAHKLERICDGYKKVCTMLNYIGFNEIAYCFNGNICFEKI